MTALTTRDALAKAVRAVYDRHDHRAPLNHVNLVEWVDALLASGAVIDAATLANDERWTDVLTDAMLDDGHTGFGDCRPSVSSLDVTSAKALRALAAALTERGAR